MEKHSCTVHREVKNKSKSVCTDPFKKNENTVAMCGNT